MTAKSSENIDAGSTSVQVVGLTLRAGARRVDESRGARAVCMRVAADVGATALLVLARDGTSSADSLAVRSSLLSRSAEGEDSDREDGGELHVGVGKLFGFGGEEL